MVNLLFPSKSRGDREDGKQGKLKRARLSFFSLVSGFLQALGQFIKFKNACHELFNYFIIVIFILLVEEKFLRHPIHHFH